MNMVQDIQRLKHSVIQILGKEFKHDFDEFSLILSNVEKTPNGYVMRGKFHAYSLGRYRFTLSLEGEKYLLTVRKMFLPGDKPEQH